MRVLVTGVANGTYIPASADGTGIGRRPDEVVACRADKVPGDRFAMERRGCRGVVNHLSRRPVLGREPLPWSAIHLAVSGRGSPRRRGNPGWR